MKTIELSKGMVAIVDDADFDLVSMFTWYAQESEPGRFYAAHKSENRFMLMHRFLLKARKNDTIDHRDGNGLNNQRRNLRLCTQAQNVANARLSKANRSGVKGVHFSKARNKWCVQIMHNHKRFSLGRFNSLKEAKAVRAEAGHRLNGEFARESS